VREIERSPVLIGGEAEEIALLLDPFDGGARGRELLAALARRQLAFIEIGLVADRVPAGVFAEIDVVLRHAAPEFLRAGLVPRLGRADEIVIGDAECVIERAELRRHLVDQRLRRDAELARRLFDFLPVLVHAGLEAHVITVEAHEARQRVDGDHLVGMADMGLAIRVRDRGGQVIAAGGHLQLRGGRAQRAASSRAKKAFSTTCLRSRLMPSAWAKRLVSFSHTATH
jgi:hypothetical protein